MEDGGGRKIGRKIRRDASMAAGQERCSMLPRPLLCILSYQSDPPPLVIAAFSPSFSFSSSTSPSPELKITSHLLLDVFIGICPVGGLLTWFPSDRKNESVSSLADASLALAMGEHEAGGPGCEGQTPGEEIAHCRLSPLASRLSPLDSRLSTLVATGR